MYYKKKLKFSKVSDKKAQEFRHIYIYSIVNVTSAAFIVPIPKIFVTKVAILQLESVRYRQRHNLLAYMMYMYSTLSLQCIIGRFSTVAVFSCFVSVERLCSRVLVYISRNKSKTGPEWQFVFLFNLLCE